MYGMDTHVLLPIYSRDARTSIKEEKQREKKKKRNEITMLKTSIAGITE